MTRIAALPWRGLLLCALLCAGIAIAAGVARAGRPALRTFAVRPSEVGGLTRGPDGDVWFTAQGERDYVGRAVPAAIAAKLPIPGGYNVTPTQLVWGPDGNVWFIEDSADGRIWRITPLGVASMFSVPGNEPWIQDITAGSDGNLWFTDRGNNAIGQITPAGNITLFSTGLGRGVEPRWIATGAEGDEWFTEAQKPGGAAIGRVTPSGEISEYPLPAALGAAEGITLGPDGNVWLAATRGIGQVTPGGVVTAFTGGLRSGPQQGERYEAPPPTPDRARPGGPAHLASGPEDSLWFTQRNSKVLGRITPAGEITQFATCLEQIAGSFEIAAGPGETVWFAHSRELAMLDVPSLAGELGAAGSQLSLCRTRRYGEGFVVELACNSLSNEACIGSLDLSTRERMPAESPRRTAPAMRPRARRLSLAAQRFTLAAGRYALYYLQPNRTGRELKKRLKHLALKLTITSHAAEGAKSETVTKRLTL